MSLDFWTAIHVWLSELLASKVPTKLFLAWSLIEIKPPKALISLIAAVAETSAEFQLEALLDIK